MLKKATILFFLVLIFSTYSSAQSMTSRNLLNNLVPYWEFLEGLRTDLSESTDIAYTSVLQQAYSFIQLELRDEEGQLFLQLKYQIQSDSTLALYSFYCDNKNIAAQLETQAKKLLTHFEWHTPSKNNFKLTDKQIQYLEIADRIAAVGNDIFADPSFYNLFILKADLIKLEQINRRNSRSIDHKESYFLRDLYFLIPLKDKKDSQKTAKINHSFIGDLEIYFGDSSAKSQRGTGDKIQLQLEEELKNYR